MRNIIHFLPLVTTAISIPFTLVLYRHWRKKPDAWYFLWWMLGVFFYGTGTLTESLTTLLGWSPLLFRSWYITGALLGGAPLAQGTVYLFFSDRTAHRLAFALALTIICVSVLVLLSPLEVSKAEPYRLSGAVLEWQWLRLFTPIINLYAFIFLVGGAFWSAYKYLRKGKPFKSRFWGNLFIAVGALLPGIGGGSAKAGFVEVLYITELIGIVLIWTGYRIIHKSTAGSVYAKQQKDEFHNGGKS